MKIEISEYDNGLKAIVIDGITVTEELGTFFNLAPGYDKSVPAGWAILDPEVSQLSFKDDEVFFTGISLKHIMSNPNSRAVLLVSCGPRDRDTNTNIARVVKVITDKKGKLEFNPETGELSDAKY
jgi:hypothetical protein